MLTKKKTYLTKWEEFVGKTVEKVDLADTDELLIHFTDGTIAYIVAAPEGGFCVFGGSQASLELGI